MTQNSVETNCTCCEPARPINFSPTYEDWVHLDDADPEHNELEGTEASTVHVHVDSESRDCDGRYDRSHVTKPSDLRDIEKTEVTLGQDQTVHQVVTSARDVWRLMVQTYVYTDADYGKAEIEVERRGGDTYLTQSRRTDEGYESMQLRTCSDTGCIDEPSSFRDHTAEAAGY